ncbi:Frataxin [Backusella circina FSU 941]|nr:Frataxin [Backusella circina FSU 941]
MLRRLAFTSAKYIKPSLATSVARYSLRPCVVYTKASLTPSRQPFSTTSIIRDASKPTFTITELSTERYHRLADQYLEHIVEKLEEIGDETDLPGYDIEYSQGVMTLSLGEHGTYVINKQPPNHQIWLSSPVSGPQRYDFDETHHTWFYHRDNHTLQEILESEISEAMGEEVKLLEGFEPTEL